MIKNSITLMGRVGKFQDVQYFDSVTMTTINLGVKGKDKYNNFFVKFFDTQTCALSEWIINNVKEGDYIQLKGKLQVNEYEVEGSDKKKSSISVIGYAIAKVRYDEVREEWLYVKGQNINAYKQPEPETASENVSQTELDDEIPF